LASWILAALRRSELDNSELGLRESGGVDKQEEFYAAHGDSTRLKMLKLRN